MYERILVPLDGSELAEKILPYVTELAKKCNSQVIVLQANPALDIPTPEAEIMRETIPGDMSAPATIETSIDIARERHAAEHESAEERRAGGSRYLTSISEKLHTNGVNVQMHEAEGKPAEVILNYARQAGASLIAMSTHGRGGLGRLIYGSVAGEVLSKSTVPVLLFRPQAD